MNPEFSTTWRYFGRRGASKIYEIYRLPASVTRLQIDDTLQMERLKQDGSWVHDPSDHGLYKEMAGGWFDDDDEIAPDLAAALFQAWNSSAWPGRP